MINKKHIIITAVITFFVTAALMIFVVGGGLILLLPQFADTGAQKLQRIETLIDGYYIYDYDKEKMMDSALSAFAAEVGDPYTQYINKEDFKEMMQSVEGDYVGIGVEVTVDQDDITVIAPFDDSPAARAGILPGDKIVKVDGVNVSAQNYNEAISMIKGDGSSAGKRITLTVKRGDENMDIIVEREKVIITTAKERMLENGVGYIRISNFGDHTADEFTKCLDNLKAYGVKGIVIDLRNNPGGTLDSVVKVADYLLPEANIITIKDKQGNEKKYDSDSDYNDLPLCVLINKYSASASEALAGAIADNGRGILIGEKSFGKGIVQSIFEMGDGTAFKLTTAKYYTPGGTCIDKVGITPQIEVGLDEEMSQKAVTQIPYERDYQLQRAVQELK
ncbi:MAG: S41 family peptidase [Clostridia bacterium]|nr:S41 family peptidase [Clostridia bacterium]